MFYLKYNYHLTVSEEILFWKVFSLNFLLIRCQKYQQRKIKFLVFQIIKSFNSKLRVWIFFQFDEVLRSTCLKMLLLIVHMQISL